MTRHPGSSPLSSSFPRPHDNRLIENYSYLPPSSIPSILSTTCHSNSPSLYPFSDTTSHHHLPSPLPLSAKMSDTLTAISAQPTPSKPMTTYLRDGSSSSSQDIISSQPVCVFSSTLMTPQSMRISADLRLNQAEHPQDEHGSIPAGLNAGRWCHW